MPADSFTIKQNDTKPDLQRTLKNADGTAIDLTGASVKFHMKRGETDGVVKYVW
jgi:hypothetical protein